MEEKEIQAKILFSLRRGGYIGGQHTSFDDACKGFPSHERKRVKKEVKKLIKERILLPKQAGYGLHISINPKMKDLVEELISKLEDDLYEF